MDVAVSEILSAAIDFERRGYAFYREAEGRTADPAARRMFAKLASDEQHHAAWLEKEAASLRETGQWLEVSEEELSRRLGGVGRLTFPEPAAFAAARPQAHELDALQRGIQTEKESIAYYARAAQRTANPRGKRTFERLVEVEEGHLLLLQGEFDYLTKSGFYYGIPEFDLEGMV